MSSNAIPGDPIPVWSTDLCVSNAALDEQHITLLELGRSLLLHLERKTPADEDIHLALQDLISVARRHCALEEEVLQSHGCPDLPRHQAAHAQSLTLLEQLLQDAQHGRLDRGTLRHVVTDWMVHHLRDLDLPARAWLQAG